MLSRRDLFKQTCRTGLAAALLSRGGAAIGADTTPEGGEWVNDTQSRLNRTRVARVVRPGSLDEVQAAVRAAGREARAVSVCGGRHAMGGQQFGEDAVLLDLRGLNRVVHLDEERGLVEVEAGIQWPELVDHLRRAQEGRDAPWGIRQKQTGVDRVTLAGTLAANAHGRGLKYPPIVGDVESFVIVGADGVARSCSRRENAELFSLVIGGYGLFGVVTQVTLRLAPRRKVRRAVQVIEVRDLPDLVGRRVEEGYLFGDCQYSTDFAAEGPHLGIFSCYGPAADDAGVPADQASLSAEDWARLIRLAHVDKAKAFEAYTGHYRATDGQVYWSDTHQMTVDFGDYHAELDRALGAKHPGTEVITEVYVRREDLGAFLREAARDVREHGIDLIYGTIRFIEKDEETFLAWARDRSACVLCNLHVEHTKEGLAKAAGDFRRLIQRALDHGGRYFLTYHRWATKRQVRAAYPQLADFLRLKRKYDPHERFQSTWYRHYRDMFADEL